MIDQDVFVFALMGILIKQYSFRIKLKLFVAFE